jgi:hypothetical protein
MLGRSLIYNRNNIAGAAISMDGFLPQIPRLDKHKSLQPNKSFMERQFNISFQSLTFEEENVM